MGVENWGKIGEGVTRLSCNERVLTFWVQNYGGKFHQNRDENCDRRWVDRPDITDCSATNSVKSVTSEQNNGNSMQYYQQ